MSVKQEQNYKYSLFSRFITIIFLMFISIILCISWKISKLRQSFVNENIAYIAKNISQNLSNDIHYIEDKMRFIGDVIIVEKIQDSPQKIFNLLKKFSNKLPNQQNNIWSFIGWSDYNYQLILTNETILNTPINLTSRLYCPLKLCFDKAKSSYFSKDYIIPVAMGLQNNEGEYIGSIHSGIDTNSLVKNITSFIENNDYYYMLANYEDRKVIIRSPNFHGEDIKVNFAELQHAQLETKSYINDDKNYAVSKVKDFPFIIIIGAKHIKMDYKDYLYRLLPYKFELLLGLSILCGLIYFFYRSILAPFMRISEAALAISNGDIDIEIKEISSREGALVASALEKIKSSIQLKKDLVNELSQARSNLAITNLRLENKVSERTKELEEALAYKTTFLHNLSHEILLPMQGISSIAENLSTYWNELTEKNRLEFASQVSFSSNRLLSMISNLLDFSKFMNGKISLVLTKFDLSELTKEVISECQILYMNKKSVNINFPDDRPRDIVADRERIHQVLRNLFINAIRFSPNNSDIAIHITASKVKIGNVEQDAFNYMIHDQGSGLDESEIADIFSPFTQGRKTTSKPGSVGLGLTICREIILSHYGKVWATNNKDGGATFSFIIPVTQPVQLDQDYSLPAATDLHHAEPNILIIDDEEVCLNSMEILLYKSKYNLIKTNSGQAGLKYLQQHYKSISLIMLDLMMPDMYGLNVLAEIKKDKNLSKIPIILQTGTSDEDEIIKAFDMGIACFIRKPYKKQTVLNEIEKALKAI